MITVLPVTSHNDVGVIVIDRDTAAALRRGGYAALREAADRGVRELGATALVIELRGGAATDTGEPAIDEAGDALAALARLEVPLTAALSGVINGPMLEVALACRARVAHADTELRFDNLRVGRLPAPGTAHRIATAAELTAAIDIYVHGLSLGCERALASGLLNAVVSDDVVTAAIGAVKTSRAPEMSEPARQQLFTDARLRLAAVRGGPRIRHVALDVLEAAALLDHEAALRVERDACLACAASQESRAMVHLARAEQAVADAAARAASPASWTVNRAAVIGAGTMGSGIAMAYANAGIRTILRDVDDQALARAMTGIDRYYAASVARQRLTPDQAARSRALITPSSSDRGFDSVDIVVEAAFEDMALKEQLFAELGRVTRPGCILASNTSTLDIDRFASASGRPASVVGHHFFSPAHLMQLVEIVEGRETAPAVLSTSLALAARLGKVGVVVGNCFGFVANRMLGYYMREAALMLEEGATVAQVDGALTGFGFPVGPFGMQDIAGIDVGWRIRQSLRANNRTRASGPESALADRLYALGRYGQKTGAGWYRYEPGSRQPITDPIVDELAAEESARRGTVRRAISAGEIVDRTMTALVNEGARILQDGFARRASDVDLIYCHGFGFPRHRGGPMFHGNAMGAPALVARLRDYQARFGDHWAPAPLLTELAAAGRGFYDETAGWGTASSGAGVSSTGGQVG